MPTKNEIIDYLKEYKQKNQDKLFIEKLGLFGSFARDEQSQNSDIDVVVQFSKPNLFTQAGIMEDLKEKFHIDVDVIALWDKMNPRLKNRIQKDVIYV